MTNNLVIGLVIGATLSASFRTVFSSAKRATEQLGNGILKATQSQKTMGEKIVQTQQRQIVLQQRISQAIYSGDNHANKLIRRYERIQTVLSRTVEKQNKFTQAIERANKAQSALSQTIAKQDARRAEREKYKSDLWSATATTAAVVIPAWKSVKTYMQQEDASNDLKVAMMKKDGSFGRFEEIDRLTDALGKRLPGSKVDFTRDAISLKNQGISEDVIYNGGLKTSAELGVLMDMQYGESGEFLAKFMEARGLKESELAQAADYLQRAKFAGGLSKDQMYGSMSYNASTIRSLGLTGLENTKKLLALEGMAGQQGLEGTSFGTNFSTMLEKLNEGPKSLANAKKGMKAEAKAMMKAAKVDFNFFKDGKFIGIDGTLKELLKFRKIKDKFGEEGVGLVAKQLFGVEGGRVAKVLLEQGEEGLANFLAKMDEQASLDQRIEQKISTLSAALESLGGVWETASGAIGSAFAEDLRSLANWASSLLENDIVPWLKENKQLVKFAIATATAFTGLSVAVLATKFVFSGAVSAFSAFFMPFKLFSSIKAVKELDKLNGKVSLFSKVAKSVSRFTKALMFGTFSALKTVTSATWGFAKMLTTALFTGAKMAFSATIGLAKVLGGALTQGVMLAGKAFMWLGRALLMNPIGLAITAIAVGAYLIYTYWTPIKAFFGGIWDWVTEKFNGAWQWIQSAWSGVGDWVANAWGSVTGFFGNLWTEITTAFDGGILGVGQLILNWSPIRWFYHAFSAVLSWFGIEMPANFSTFASQMLEGFTQWVRSWDILGTFKGIFNQVFTWFGNLPSRFLDFGRNIVTGLKNGLQNMFSSAKAESANLAVGVKEAFTTETAIHSPSRVFKGYGVNIVEGLTMGMENNVPLATHASQQLGHAVGSAFSVAKAEKGSWLDNLWGNLTQLGTGLGQFFALSPSSQAVRTPNFNPNAREDGLFADYQPLRQAQASALPPGNSGGITVHFSPTIHLGGATANPAGLREQLMNALKDPSLLYEFERLIRQATDQYQRRAY